MDLDAIMNSVVHYASYWMLGMYVLVLTVNIITEVMKRLLPVPAELLVFLVSIAVTLLALFTVSSVMAIHVEWYFILSAVVLGIFVAYAAMFGFEKFKNLWEHLNTVR